MSAEGATPAAVPELRPVTGPSAFGGGKRRFLDLLWVMSSMLSSNPWAQSYMG